MKHTLSMHVLRERKGEEEIRVFFSHNPQIPLDLNTSIHIFFEYINI